MEVQKEKKKKQIPVRALVNMVTPAGRRMQRWKWNPSSYPEHEMPVADLSFPLLLLGGDINPMTVQTCPLIVNISRGG